MKLIFSSCFLAENVNLFDYSWKNSISTDYIHMLLEDMNLGVGEYYSV